MPEPVECEMARPSDRQNRVSENINKMWHVAYHVWRVDDCIEFLENDDCCGAEDKVGGGHFAMDKSSGEMAGQVGKRRARQTRRPA
jgi:hypothetical protein